MHIGFKLALYSLFTAAGSVFLVILKHRLKQRCLWKIPGPSNPSLLWGKFLLPRDLKLGLMGSKGHEQQMFGSSASDFQQGLRQIYGKVSRFYSIFGVWNDLLG